MIALGGGSVVEAAEVMVMPASQLSNDLWDYAGAETGKQKRLDKQPLS